MFSAPPDRRLKARALPVAPPLRSTAGELRDTAAAHHKRIRKADAFLDDIEQMDGALRLVRR